MSFLFSKIGISFTVFVITISLCLQIAVILDGSNYYSFLLKLFIAFTNLYTRSFNKYPSPTSIGNHIETTHNLCLDGMNNTASCEMIAMNTVLKSALPDWTHVLHNEPHTLLDKLKNHENMHPPFGTYYEYFDIHGINALLIHTSPKLTKKKLFSNGLIIHLHGGAYIVGSHKSDHAFMSYLHLFTTLPVLAIDYKLAPKYPLQSGALLDDGNIVINDYLHNHLNVDYNKMYLIGVSAGGGAVLMWMNEFAKQNIHFGGVIPVSPWSDLETSTTKTQSYISNEKYDNMLNYDALVLMRMYALGCRDMNGAVVGDNLDKCVETGIKDLKDVDMNPTSADWSWGKDSNTKLLFVASKYEILRDDAVRTHEKALKNGMDSELMLMDNAMHALPIMTHIPEALQCIVQISHVIYRWINN